MELLNILSLLFGGLIGFVILFILYLVVVLREKAVYFKKHGIPNLGISLSRTWRLMTGSLNIITMDEEMYQEAVETQCKIVGMSDMFGKTNLYITDLDLIENIMVKNFDHFVNLRPIKTEKCSKYFLKMLFTMRDEQWSELRSKLRPAFTTGKVWKMFHIFQSSSEQMEKYIKEQMISPTKHKHNLDFAKILFKYSMATIANCLGTDSKSWELPPEQMSTFERFGTQMEFRSDANIIQKFTLISLAPKIADICELEVTDSESQNYFANLIKDVIERRRETGERREDFLQLMLDAKQGHFKDESNGSSRNGCNGNCETNSAAVFSEEEIIASAMQFFLAGFDTTQSVLLFTLYSLAVEQEVQQKLYEEIMSVLDKYEGQITFEAVSDMTYLDWVINETMRMYPATTRTERCCSKAYPVPDTDFVIEKGTIIGIPQYGIHMDERYWPNPKRFIPERFSPENKASRHRFAFMPFGHGPRSCIAMRFALVKIKTVIAHVVKSFLLEPSSKTQVPPEFSSNACAKPKEGMWLSVTIRPF